MTVRVSAAAQPTRQACFRALRQVHPGADGAGSANQMRRDIQSRSGCLRDPWEIVNRFLGRKGRAVGLQAHGPFIEREPAQRVA